MGASPSSFRVEETDLNQYSYSTILEKEIGEKESFKLYRVTNLRFEAVLSRNDQNPKCLSLFRMDDEKLAREKFKRLYKAISPFYKTSIKCYNPATMQELIDTMDQHPDWSLADIAKYLDLRECLNHDRIAASSSTEQKKSSGNPLQVACKSGKLDFIQSLTSVNARDFVKDRLGNTPLHYAAENYPEVLISMIQKAQYVGVQLTDVINSHNMDNQTALDVACHFSQDEGVKVLLEAGADVNHVEGYQKPIHTALKSNGTRCAALILEFHPEQIKEKDLKYGAFPLHWAKTKEAVRLLLGQGAKIECENDKGETALHVMARRRRLGCVIALLSSGANVNATSNDGSTPLHVAAQADDCDIVRALIVFGAEVNATNNQHNTARHIATEQHQSRWKDVVDALCYVGASPCDPGKNKCNLPCKKEFKGEYRIGDSVNKVTPGLFQSPGYEDLIRAAAVSAALYSSSAGKDKVDGPKQSRTKSIFKQKHNRDAVLAMDGGGIKGLVLIQLLLAIEEITGESIIDLFDWIGGTSTGGILALALIHGKPTRYCQGLYFNLKDEVFNGPRPYNSEPLERFLKHEFGENTNMTAVAHPKALVTAVLADRRPASLYFFRNYQMPEDEPKTAAKSPFPSPPPPSEQQVWRAARGTGAAPTFFRSMGRFLDGGLMANNPTLDIMTEIYKYYKVHHGSAKGSSNIGLVVSLGTGVAPTEHVMNIDVFKPDSIWDATNVITGARALGMLLVDQACATHGPVVERARCWCETIGVPFYRLSSDMSVEVGLDETDDKVLVKMLWETKVYVLQHFKQFKELAQKLTK